MFKRFWSKSKVIQHPVNKPNQPLETRVGGFSTPCRVSSTSKKGFSPKMSVYSVIPRDHISSSGPRYLNTREANWSDQKSKWVNTTFHFVFLFFHFWSWINSWLRLPMDQFLTYLFINRSVHDLFSLSMDHFHFLHQTHPYSNSDISTTNLTKLVAFTLSTISVLTSGTTSPMMSDIQLLSLPSKTNSRHFSSLSISTE